MAQTVKLKRSNTAGTIPTTSNLALGEVAINTKDGKLFIRKHVDGSTGDAIHAYAPQGLNAFGTQELVVKVVTKTTAHPNHGNGSSSGYTVQGLEGPFLALIPGNTYKFDQSDNSNSGHPFRFYLDAAKATAYTTGVTTSGSAGNSGAYVQIAVTTSTPQVLYYQCSAHSLMGSGAYVASDAIAANAVGTSQIAQNSITSSEIPNNSIGATQISAAVLAAKQDNLGNNSITAAMISQNTVGISELNVSDGSNGQVLTTNGSGTLSFAAQSAGTVTETFKTVSVSGQDDVVADGATDTLTLAAGSGMTITTNASNDTVTFVSSASGIADDAVTTSKIADLNVTSAKLAGNSVTAAKIATGAVGASEIAANAVGISELNVSDGSNGQVLTTNGSGTLSFASATGSVSEAFKTLSVSGQDDVVADSATDTLTFAAGSNMTITSNASNDTITFASSGSGGSSSSFAKNTFTGDGSDTTFTLTTSMSNENGLIVFIDGVYQADNVYSVSGTTLTFATAPVNGRVIEVFQMEGGIVGTAPVLATMTGDGSDTTLTLGTTPSSENQCFVTIDGVMQHKSTYSVSGSTLTFSTAPPNGTAVEAITLTNTSVATFQDSDGDTKIQMEESSDEDKIRFDTAGTERMVLDSGSLTVTPKIVSDAGIDIDNFNIDGTTISLSSGDMTIDAVAGDIVFDAHGNDFLFRNSSNLILGFYTANNDFLLQNNLNDKDVIFKGYDSDGGGLLEALRIDYSEKGNIGIGTSTPTFRLDVNGNLSSNGNENVMRIAGSDTNNAGGITINNVYGSTAASRVSTLFSIDGQGQASPLAFGNGTSEAMRISSSGKVGIGMTDPQAVLDVVSSGATSTAFRVLKSGTSTQNLHAATEISGHGRFSIYDDSENEDIRFDSNGNSYFNGGNVGIGLTSPQSNLHVHGASSGDVKLQITNNSTGSAATDGFNIIVEGPTPDVLLRNRENSNMRFLTNNSERMRIASGGGVAIGTTTPDGVSNLTVKSQNATAGQEFVSLHHQASSGTIYFMSFMTGSGNGSDVGYITHTGTTGAFTAASDISLKENIRDLPEGLDVITKLKPRLFDWKEAGKGTNQVGFIAQEVEEIKPEWVHQKEDIKLLSSNLPDTIPYLIKAIQEQQDIIEDLKSRIKTLEG